MPALCSPHSSARRGQGSGTSRERPIDRLLDHVEAALHRAVARPRKTSISVRRSKYLAWRTYRRSLAACCTLRRRA